MNDLGHRVSVPPDRAIWGKVRAGQGRAGVIREGWRGSSCAHLRDARAGAVPLLALFYAFLVSVIWEGKSV